jgi:hypothetical protein
VRVFPDAVARVRLRPRVVSTAAREWITGRNLGTAGVLDIEVPPGESRYVEFSAP